MFHLPVARRQGLARLNYVCPIPLGRDCKFPWRTASALRRGIDLEGVDIAEIGFDSENAAVAQVELFHIHGANSLIALRFRVVPEPLEVKAMGDVLDASRDDNNAEETFLVPLSPQAAGRGEMDAWRNFLGCFKWRVLGV